MVAASTASQLRRWFRLALACLALLVGGPAAQALPPPDAASPTAVLRLGAARRMPRCAAQPTRPGEDSRLDPVPRRLEVAVVPRERPPPGPDLFLLHQALLR